MEQRLPAIEFHARILRKQAWDRWKAALPHAKSMREAARVQDRKLCCESPPHELASSEDAEQTAMSLRSSQRMYYKLGNLHIEQK